MQRSAEKRHFLARYGHVGLGNTLCSLGFHFWVGAVNQSNESKHQGLLLGLEEEGLLVLAATEDKGSKVISTEARAKKGDSNNGWFPA